MTKKLMIWGLIVVAALIAGKLIVGCGQQETTPTTTTPTTTIEAAYVNTAKAGAMVASGGSTLGNGAAMVGSAAGKSVTVQSLSVRASQADSGPPDIFFITDMRTSSDGWIRPTTQEVAGGKITPYMRMYDRAGSALWGSTFNPNNIRKVANLSPCTMRIIMSGGPGAGMPTGLMQGIQSFTYLATTDASTAYYAISTEGDYLGWAFVMATMEAGFRQDPHFALPANIHLSTPEAGALNKIGTMECKMVFGSGATGEVIVSVSVEEGGKPNNGSYSGTGSVTFGGVAHSTTITLTFSNGNPSSMTITLTDPSGNVLTLTGNPQTGIATGTLKDSAGNTIGTLEASSTGGKIYKGGTSEAFTF